MSKRYEYDLTVYFQNSYICTEWKSTKYGLRDQVHRIFPKQLRLQGREKYKTWTRGPWTPSMDRDHQNIKSMDPIFLLALKLVCL